MFSNADSSKKVTEIELKMSASKVIYKICSHYLKMVMMSIRKKNFILLRETSNFE